jgi:uncharacterized membrane protein
MADLIIIAYDSEEKAEAARNKVLELQKEYLIEIGDAVVAVRREDGHIKLNQLVNTTAAGAATGGMWGALVGLLFLNPLIGAALGAGAGALGGHFTDVGIDDKFMKDAAAALGPGQAALCLLIRRITADKVIPAIRWLGVAHQPQRRAGSQTESRLESNLKPGVTPRRRIPSSSHAAQIHLAQV